MPKKKKSVKKDSVMKRKKNVKKIIKVSKSSKTDKMLMENFVSLQKVLLNMSMKLENLTGKISNLLELFEISAKTFAEKEGIDYEKYSGGKELSQKVESLMEQNRTIAKGLAMMYEKQGVGGQAQQGIRSPMPQQFPQQNPRAQMEGYQRSLSASEPETNTRPNQLPRNENA